MGNSAEYSSLYDTETQASWGRYMMPSGRHTPRIEEPGPLSHFILIWGPYLLNPQCWPCSGLLSDPILAMCPNHQTGVWHWTRPVLEVTWILWHSRWRIPTVSEPGLAKSTRINLLFQEDLGTPKVGPRARALPWPLSPALTEVHGLLPIS